MRSSPRQNLGPSPFVVRNESDLLPPAAPISRRMDGTLSSADLSTEVGNGPQRAAEATRPLHAVSWPSVLAERPASSDAREKRMLVTIGHFDDLPALTDRLAELFDTTLHFTTWQEARPFCREASCGLLVASPTVPRQDRFELSRLAPPGLKRLLLGMDDTVDRVVCLNMGADEALASDIDLHEICARARRIFRGDVPVPQPTFDVEWLASRSLRSLKTPDGVRIGLSPAEWSCLLALAEHPDQLVTSQMAARHIQGLQDATSPDTRLRMQMSRLRRRLAPHFREEPIISVYGSGYALAFNVRLVD